MVLIDHLSSEAPAGRRSAPPARSDAAPVDERAASAAQFAARRSLRRQIERLERQLSATLSAAFPHVPAAGVPAARAAGPRLLDLGELELVRDDLADRLRRARVVVAQRAELEAAGRALLEEMLRDPARHRRVRLPLADLGEPGCGAYHVRPRLGLVGMLMGWWQVKLSSGCPLAR